MITSHDKGLDFWDRLGCIWLNINQDEFDLIKEMAKSKIKSEEKKLDKLLEFSCDTVDEYKKRDDQLYRVDFLKRIINTEKLPVSKNKSNYKD
jgi:hypothetical protein